MKTLIFLSFILTTTLVLAGPCGNNGETCSSNMNMPIPAVGVTKGPQYATDINNSLLIVDKHNHSPGFGVPITPSGLNISSDLTCQNNNLTNIRATRFFPQASPISGTSPDIGELYESGVDLYYNDGAGNQIRITQSGSVAGASGTITGLPSGTASASYSGASGTFSFLQATSTGANIDAATYILRYPGSYPTPSGNYIAFQAPSALATGYALTYPSNLPGTSNAFLTSSNAGALSWTNVDNSTLQYASNIISVASGGITSTQIAANAVGTTQIAANAVTRPKLAAVGQQTTSSSGLFNTQNLTFTSVTNLSLSITTTGRPVIIMLEPDGTLYNGSTSTRTGVWMDASSGTTIGAQVGVVRIRRASSPIVDFWVSAASAQGSQGSFPPPLFLDLPGAGTYTYDVQVEAAGGLNPRINVQNMILVAYEL